MSGSAVCRCVPISRPPCAATHRDDDVAFCWNLASSAPPRLWWDSGEPVDSTLLRCLNQIELRDTSGDQLVAVGRDRLNDLPKVGIVQHYREVDCPPKRHDVLPPGHAFRGNPPYLI